VLLPEQHRWITLISYCYESHDCENCVDDSLQLLDDVLWYRIFVRNKQFLLFGCCCACVSYKIIWHWNICRIFIFCV